MDAVFGAGVGVALHVQGRLVYIYTTKIASVLITDY